MDRPYFIGPFWPRPRLQQNNFSIYHVASFFKKIDKNTCRYHYQNLDDMICSSWDIERNILKFFALLSPLKSCKNQNFEKSKNLLEISFYTCVPKITITWCIVPEIRSETDRIVCHFGPFFVLLPSPLPLMIPKIKILKKFNEKNAWRYYSFTDKWYMCTMNEDHMIYSSWNIRCDRQNFLSFWAIFCPLSPLTIL